MKRTHIHHKILWLSLLAMLIGGILAPSAVAQLEEGTAEETIQSEEPRLKTSEQTETAADSEEEGEEINGSADNLERFEKDGITILTGNVKILRTDGYLNADKVTFYTDPVTGDTVRTVAENNVEIRDAEIFATCEHATMEHLTNTIILKTDVVVLQNKDRLETVLFTYNRTTGEQTAQGDVKFKVRVIEAEPAPAEEAPEATGETGETAEGADETAAADAPATATEGETPATETGEVDASAAAAEGETPAEEGAEKGETKAESEAEESVAPVEEETGSSDDDSAAEDSQQAEDAEVENETEEEK